MQASTKQERGVRHVLSLCSTYLKKGAKNVTNAIHEFWSMTIKTQARKTALSVASLLMGIAGRLDAFGQRSENVESSVQTATVNIPSSSKDTTPKRKFSGSSELSQDGINLTYNSPHDFLYDVARGILHPSEITLEQWLIANGYAMIDSKLPDLEAQVMIGGQLFGLHHCIKSVHYPNHARPLMEIEH